jgi:hypothetical protein
VTSSCLSKQTISGIFSPFFSACSKDLKADKPQGPAPIIATFVIKSPLPNKFITVLYQQNAKN